MASAVHVPVSSRESSAFPEDQGRVGLTTNVSVEQLHNGGVSRDGYRLFLFVQASRFACHPDRSHRSRHCAAGRPWRLRPSRMHGVTFMHVGYASRLTRAIDGRGLPPHKTRGLVGRSILLPHEVRALVHKGERDGKVSYWLSPKQYAIAEFEERWDRIGLG